MNELIILGIRDKGGKDISTNNKEIGGKGVSLSKPPFRTKFIGRLPINKDRKSDSFNTLHNGVGEVRGKFIALRVSLRKSHSNLS
jgi:hypothetical protein